MFNILLEVYSRAVYYERNCCNSMVNKGLHVGGEHDLELSLSWAERNIVLPTKGQGKLKEAVELVQVVGD